MRITACAVLVVVLGCTRPGSHVVEDDPAAAARRRKEAERVATLVAKKVQERCAFAESPPRIQAIAVKGYEVDQRCGLVVHARFSAKYVSKFVAKVCREDIAGASHACGSLFLRAFVARLAARYYAADFASLVRKCAAYPVDCTNSRVLESWFFESHNLEIDRAIEKGSTQIDAERQAEQRATAIADAFVAAARGWRLRWDGILQCLRGGPVDAAVAGCAGLGD